MTHLMQLPYKDNDGESIMLNILFVDDEPNILDGLQRMLRSMRREWQMLFADSGIQALKILEYNHVDVIVSDMKMPGMDGSQLLKEVENRFPQIVRIILSGYSEKALILTSVGTAHQYLSKPCDSEILKYVVKRACSLRSLLQDDNLRRIVSKMQSVPSIPTLYLELLEQLKLDEPDIGKIALIVKKDPGMTVKVLQLVNSAFFGLRRNISDANEAIQFLGLETISALALGVGIFSQFESKINPELLGQLWQDSVAVSNLARQIAIDENPVMANDAFTVGLVHNIGKIILAVNMPQEFVTQQLSNDETLTIQKLQNKIQSNPRFEEEVFETSYSQVGAYLLGLWGLPVQIVEGVAFHQSPSKSGDSSFSPLTAVYLANYFYHFSQSDISERTELELDRKYIEKLGLVDKIPVWYEKFVGSK